MRSAAAFLLAACLGCAGSGGTRDDYLRYTAYEGPGGDWMLLRWQQRELPLRVYLPAPPPGSTSDPEAVRDAVRDGITDWTDVAGPGVPRFVFVDDQGEADIPIAWETEPSGDWYIAHCVLDVRFQPLHFGVVRILVLTQRAGGGELDLETLYQIMLHEVGHALGLAHSPYRDDLMYGERGGVATGISARDRETLRKLYSLPFGRRVSGARSTD